MQFRRGEALRRYNTLALQARAQAFVTVDTEAELLAALTLAREQQLPVVPLGEGSNVVFAGDLDVLVIQQRMKGIEVLALAADTVRLRVAAGEDWHALVQWTLAQGYFGLENLALIPGTVGAAPIQNIGAYGVELQATLLQVHARQIADDKVIALANEACEFGYRDSIFKQRLQDQLVITAIDLQLSRHPAVNIAYPALASYFADHADIEPTPQAVFDAVVSIRSSKLPDPAQVPNAGSFFKNPVVALREVETLRADFPALPCFPQHNGTAKVSAAWMIDYCGWKGVRRGDAGVHAEHALVLVNHGRASGEQLLALAAEIAASVGDTFGVMLEIEPRIYGRRA